MINDSQLEFNQQWLPYTGPGIGGPTPEGPWPTTATVTPATLANPNLETTIVGAAYTDAMYATKRPLLPVFDPTHIYYSLAFNINVDPNASAVTQALESEAAYTFTDANGISWQFPVYWQINQEEKGMVQAYASKTQPWLDTGIKIPFPTSGTPYPIKISYCVNTQAKTSSILGFVANGVSYAMPAAFQNVPAVQENKTAGVDEWTPGMYVQFQSDLNYKGGAMTNKYTGVQVDWE